MVGLLALGKTIYGAPVVLALALQVAGPFQLLIMTYWVYMASAKGANYDFVELEAQVQFLLECMGNVPAQLVETPPSFIVAFKFLLDSNTFCDLFNEQQEALPGGALYTADSPVSEGEGECLALILDSQQIIA